MFKNCSAGELGQYPLLLIGFNALLVYWHRITMLPNGKLVKQALNYQSIDNSFESQWIKTVKYLMSVLGLDAYFQNPEMIKTEAFAKLCLTKLKQKFTEQWHSKLMNTDKLRFYKLFKTNFRREAYLDLVSNFHLRRCITKFRCSDHTLKIETGRHTNLPVDERLCQTCLTKVETEEHFLRWCPKYNVLRFKYFGRPHYFLDWLEILKCKNRMSAYNLGNFLTKAFVLRNKATCPCA